MNTSLTTTFQPGHQLKQRTLVCFIGTMRALEITAANLFSKLIEPLDADVAICVSRLTADDEQQLKLFGQACLVDVCIYDDAVLGYPHLCDSLSSRARHGVFVPSWQEALKIEGNWAGGMPQREGSGMHLNYNYLKLWERLATPAMQARNYKRFVITRTDFQWTAPHPPLQYLDPRLIWIPEGEDYGGYNDRHAVCSTYNVEAYLCFLETLINGRALTYLRNHKSLYHEIQLWLHISHCGIRVGRFKNLAYLTGSPATPTNNASVRSETLNCKEYYYKYRNELISALENAESFSRHGDARQLVIRPPRRPCLLSKLPLWRIHLRCYSHPWIARLMSLLRSLKSN